MSLNRDSRRRTVLVRAWSSATAEPAVTAASCGSAGENSMRDTGPSWRLDSTRRNVDHTPLLLPPLRARPPASRGGARTRVRGAMGITGCDMVDADRQGGGGGGSSRDKMWSAASRGSAAASRRLDGAQSLHLHPGERRTGVGGRRMARRRRRRRHKWDPTP